MKQFFSVIMLAARSSLYKVLLLLALLGAVEGYLFYRALDREASLIGIFENSYIPFACAIGFALLCLLLCRSGCMSGGSRIDYTLRRLSVSERGVTYAWAIYNTACFLLLWGFQLALALLFCHIYMRGADPALAGIQTVFLSFYHSPFLHSLLPLAETSRYVRNFAFVLALGCTSAYVSFRQRHGQKSAAAACLALIAVYWFSHEMGSFAHDFLMTACALLTLLGATWNLWKVGLDED